MILKDAGKNSYNTSEVMTMLESMDDNIKLIAEGQVMLRGEMNKRFDEHDKRFDGVDARLDGIDTKLDKHGGMFSEINSKLETIFECLSGIDDKLENIEKRMRNIEEDIKELKTVTKNKTDLKIVMDFEKRLKDLESEFLSHRKMMLAGKQ